MIQWVQLEGLGSPNTIHFFHLATWRAPSLGDKFRLLVQIMASRCATVEVTVETYGLIFCNEQPQVIEQWETWKTLEII